MGGWGISVSQDGGGRGGGVSEWDIKVNFVRKGVGGLLDSKYDEELFLL